MSEPILSEAYWRRRLEQAPSDALHHAIFRCPTDRWRRIEEKHRQILTMLIQPHDAILDAGCGWGRLLDLLPLGWCGPYLGIDISPDFIEMANRRQERRLFMVGDLRRMPEVKGVYDWAILISMRPMVRRNLGEAAWQEMEVELKRTSHRQLYLEYDENDKGSVEDG